MPLENMSQQSDRIPGRGNRVHVSVSRQPFKISYKQFKSRPPLTTFSFWKPKPEVILPRFSLRDVRIKSHCELDVSFIGKSNYGVISLELCNFVSF